MKRSYANIPKSSKVLDFDYSCEYIDNKKLRGYLAMLRINKVAQPMTKLLGDELVKFGDVGYTWLQSFPLDRHYSTTVVFDERDNIVEWYVDIIGPVELGEDRVPYYDDFYLDIVGLPNGNIFLLDEEELEEALGKKDISREDYSLAKSQVDIVLDEVFEDLTSLEEASKYYLTYMRDRL